MSENLNDSITPIELKMPKKCFNCGSPVVKILVYCLFCENRFETEVVTQISTLFLRDKEKQLKADSGFLGGFGCLFFLISPIIVFLVSLNTLPYSVNFDYRIVISGGITLIEIILAGAFFMKIDNRYNDKFFDKTIAPQIQKFLVENRLSMNEFLFIADAGLKANSDLLRELHRLADKNK